ncbi:hypothetical protein C5S36_01695 [Candidatus Methanophagaceae archaeon]|nr:hypothetical protein C5S36_01695 [Methanophagales archaeon]
MAKIVLAGKKHTIIGTGYKKRLKSNVLINQISDNKKSSRGH